MAHNLLVPRGPIGKIGPTGATGAIGPKGNTGSIGTIGPQGPIGGTGVFGNGQSGLRGTNAFTIDTIPDQHQFLFTEGYLVDHQQEYKNYRFYVNDGVNDYTYGDLKPAYDNLAFNDWSVRFWFRIDASSKVSMQLFDFNNISNPGSNNSNNRIFLAYNASLNRLTSRVRTASSNFDRQWGLHDNSSVTGITNSSTGWTTGQRGNVNSDLYCMITVTYDASQSTGASAFKMYWNASELTSTAASNNGNRTDNTTPYLTVGAARHNTTSGNTPGRYDEFAVYNKVLSSSEVSTLYNSGLRAEAAQQLVTSNLVGNLSWDDGTPTCNTTDISNLGIVGGTTDLYT